MNTQITLDLPESIIEQAQVIAKQEGRSVSAYLAELIEHNIASPILYATDTPYGNAEAAHMMQDIIEASALPKVIKN